MIFMRCLNKSIFWIYIVTKLFLQLSLSSVISVLETTATPFD